MRGIGDDNYGPRIPSLPRRASGTFEGHAWELSGAIQGDRAYIEVSFIDPLGDRSGGVVRGALPLQATGRESLGDIGMTSYFHGHSRDGTPQGWKPGFLCGVVSDAVSTVQVQLDNGSLDEAIILGSGDPKVKFFFVALTTGVECTAIAAVDKHGHELDRHTIRS